MGINIQSLTKQLDLASTTHPQYSLERQKKIENMVEQFLTLSLTGEALNEKVLRVTMRLDRLVRSTAPLVEPITNTYKEPDNLQTDLISVYAGDGSEITPDPARKINYGVINLSCIYWLKNPVPADNKIQIFNETKFYIENSYQEAIKNLGGLDDQEAFSLLRDVAEREYLAKTAILHKLDGPGLVMVDGPLEIWGRRQMKNNSYRTEVQRVEKAYESLQNSGLWVIGYIDQPNSANLISMLAIANCPDNRLTEVRDYAEEIFGGLCDRDLFEVILPSGYRSAIYRIVGRSTGLLPGHLSSCCFFMNVGDNHAPHIVRVELPFWVSGTPDAVNVIHNLLLNQCRIVPRTPYPYLLTRAHEEAVLSPELREVIDRLVWSKIDPAHLPSPRPKDSAKQLTRRA